MLFPHSRYNHIVTVLSVYKEHLYQFYLVDNSYCLLLFPELVILLFSFRHCCPLSIGWEQIWLVYLFICTFLYFLKSRSLFMLKHSNNRSLTVTMFVPVHCTSILSMTENPMAHYQRVKISSGEGFQGGAKSYFASLRFC